MTATILLIRHGSHDRLDKVLCGRMEGVGLGEAGRTQAARVGERLKAEHLAAVYASPLQRARETAEVVASRAGLNVTVDDDLSELDFGSWTGRRFDELEGDEAWARWNRQRQQSRPPSGESMLDAQARAARFLERMRDRHEGETLAAISHADVIKAALCWALGLSLEFYARFEISPASVSRLAVGDWGVKVWSLNHQAQAQDAVSP